MTKRKKTIPMLPREPLTKKARAAIILYVKLRAGHTQHEVVDMTLKAERMSRAALYTDLNQRGFRWNSARQRWLELKRNPATPKPAAVKPAPVAAKKIAVPTGNLTQDIPTDPDALAQWVRDNAANISARKSI